MKTQILASIVTITFALSACGGNSTPIPTPMEPPTSYTDWQVFELDQIKAQNNTTANPYFRFLDEPAFSGGIYELDAGSSDGQSPHGNDEVYYILSGQAVLSVDGVQHPVAAGSIIFVRAGVNHQFGEITADLEVLVIFSTTPSDRDGRSWHAFEIEELTLKRNPDQNIWEEFHSTPAMRLGLYMLPAAKGGDQPLTHEFAEINIVVKGQGTFQIGETEIPIKPGTIMYVGAGIPHKFHSLADDLDVLIFFER